MSITERHILDDLIWRTVHDSDINTDTLEEVCDRVVRRVQVDTIFKAEDIDCKSRDFRIIRVDADLDYKVFVNRGWGFYDVEMV